MKTKLTLIAFLSLVSVQSFSQWILQTSNTTSQLIKIFFYDPTHGWAVGASGTIVRTTDGGITWVPSVSGTTVELNNVFFVSQDTGWATGNTILLKTINGGLTWTPQTTGATGLGDIFFRNANLGWLLTSTGIVKTTDGGGTWAATNGWTGSKIYFLSDSLGYICENGTGGFIAQTVDGGATWSNVATGAYGSQLLNMHFSKGGNAGYVCNNAFAGSGNYVARTQDRGYSWNTVNPNLIFECFQIFCVSYDTALIAGYASGGNIIRTVDGGATWQYTFPQGNEPRMNSTYFTDAVTGWCCDDNGEIWKFNATGIRTGIVPQYVCEGSAISVPFTPQGTFDNGNVFNLMLSDSTGSFTNETTLATLSNIPPDTFRVNIAGVPNGAHYRMRVEATSPATTGTDNGSNLIIETVTGSFAATQVLLQNPNLTAQFNTTINPDWTYFWSFGDDSTLTSNNATIFHSYCKNGLFTVFLTITNAGGCADTVTMSNYIDVTGIPQSNECVSTQVGITEVDAQRISISPNPSNGDFLIRFDSGTSTEARILITDLLGNAVYAENFTAEVGNVIHSIKTDKLAIGVYIITLRVAGESSNEKIVIN